MKKNPLKEIVRFYHSFTVLLLLFSCLYNTSSYASFRNKNLLLQQEQTQAYSIKGKVTDSKGVPLPGVTIRLDGTYLGVVSDVNGDFTINTTESTGNLLFSFVGYEKQKIAYTAGKFLKIAMHETSTNLEEVQVIAYGEQKKREVIGSIATVKGEDVALIPAPNLNTLLEGRMAGVNIITTSGAPGGGGISVNIRGFNTLSVEERFSNPLYVIDGVPMYSYTSKISGLNTMAEIDPKDIESVDVLKDAAAASIYGSRAANGVVLITTKKGRVGQKTKVTATYSHTFSGRPSQTHLMGGKAERYHRMQALSNYQQAIWDASINSYRYVENYKEAMQHGAQYDYFWNMGDGADIPIYQDSLNPAYNNSTDIRKIFYDMAQIKDASIQVSGGTEHTAFNIAAGYYDEEGVLRNTGFKRIKLLSNLYVEANPRIKVNFRNYLAYTSRDRSAIITDGSDIVAGQELEEIPEIFRTRSTLRYGAGSAVMDEILRRYDATIEDNESYRVRTSADISYEFLKGLSLKISGSADFSQQMVNLFKPANLNEYNETYSSAQVSRNLMLMNENLLTYKHTFNEAHNLDVLIGLSVQTDLTKNVGGYGYDIGTNQIHYVPPGHIYNVEDNRPYKDFTTDKEKSALIGVFGRINYNYKQKYLASFTLRKDASSRFGENVRWATFPAGAIGYAITEEPFMQGIKQYLNYAKLRFSVGLSGKTPYQPYVAQGVNTSGKPFLGNPTMIPLWESGLINRELTWEKTTQYDAGLDIDLFNYRLSATIDYYFRNTHNLIYPVRLKGNTNGYTTQWRNDFGIHNQGIEIQLKGDLIRTDNLRWSLAFNIARNWNRLVNSNEDEDFQTSSNLGFFQDNLNIIGKPLNGIYVYDDKGFYNYQGQVPYTFVDGKKVYLHGDSYRQFYRPGDRIISDLDGNGAINTLQPLQEDRRYAASPIPKAQGGIITNLQYKGLSLELNFSYVLKRGILNAAKGASIGTSLGMSLDDITIPVLADLDDYIFWEKPGDNANMPANRLDAGLLNYTPALASNVEIANYFTLRSAQISYRFPQRWLKKICQDFMVYFNAENVFIITNYTGADPRTVDITTGRDNGNMYPLAFRGTLGVSLTF